MSWVTWEPKSMMRILSWGVMAASKPSNRVCRECRKRQADQGPIFHQKAVSGETVAAFVPGLLARRRRRFLPCRQEGLDENESHPNQRSHRTHQQQRNPIAGRYY